MIITAAVALISVGFAGCGTSKTASTSTGSGSGSGSSSGSGSDPTGPNMQAGQWELSLTPSGGTPFYIEADLLPNGSNLLSATTTTALLQTGSGPIANAFAACFNVSLTATGQNGAFTGTLSESGNSPLFELSGTVTGTGQNVSGSYTISNLSTACTFYSVSSGTFTGYIVPSFTGTYSGSMSLTMSQDSNFNITANGTGISIAPSGTSAATYDDLGGYRNVIGAVVEAIGFDQGPSIGNAFRMFGHMTPDGKSISVVEIVPAAAGTPVWPVESGSIAYVTLTRQ